MRLSTRCATAVKVAAAAALVSSLLGVTSVDATLGSGNETPANCGSPCYTVIYKTYSPTSKWARAEWIASGGGNERLQAVAGCRTSGSPTINWQFGNVTAPWAASVKTCVAPYNYAIVDNGFSWWKV